MTRSVIALMSVICTCTLTGATASAPDGTGVPQIPLCPSLSIVTAVAQPDGDYESIKTIESVDSRQMRLKYSVEKTQYPGLFDTTPPFLKKTIIYRTVLTSDLASAKSYQQRFVEKSAVETIPGTTSIGTSAAVLQALKKTGVASLGFSSAGDGAATWTTDRNKTPNYYQFITSMTVKRGMKGPANLPVLVNGALVELPVVHAEGDKYGDKAEFFFLDDDRNPLTLAFRIGIGTEKPLSPHALDTCKNHPVEARAAYRCDLPNGGDRETLRVVQIDHRCAGLATAPVGTSGTGASGVERALAEKKNVDIYSIHFTFNSDAIREESEPTLQEIADVLRRHPEWKVLINGHTDGVGDAPYNVELSKRRAAAVKSALVNRHGVSGSRLSTWGLGEAYPKATNDTLEGRSRNRRVELKRQS